MTLWVNGTSGLPFLGTYAIYLPMHYLGFLGVPRRYYANGTTDLIPESAHTMNAGITVAALIVGTAQILFFINMIWSLRNGKKADQIRGEPRRWNGKHRRRLRRMVTGGRNCRWFIAGHTNTAPRGLSRILSRRLNRWMLRIRAAANKWCLSRSFF